MSTEMTNPDDWTGLKTILSTDLRIQLIPFPFTNQMYDIFAPLLSSSVCNLVFFPAPVNAILLLQLPLTSLKFYDLIFARS